MVGLLWFDDSSQSLRDKVEPAVRRYTEKFGRPPTVCYVHPSMLNGLGGSDNSTSAISLDIGGFCLRVKARRSVLRHHFFVGEADEGHHSFAMVFRPAPDAGRDVLGQADSGKWVQSPLQTLEEVPGGGPAL